MSQLPNKESSRAVFFGGSYFESALLEDLPAVDRNLNDFSSLLSSPETGVFDQRHVRVLRGAEYTGIRDLYLNLRRAAEEANGTFFVYYSGHGIPAVRSDGLYLGLPDTDVDALSVSAFSIDAIRDIFLDCPARNKILVLDCCFSGRAASGFMAAQNDLLAVKSEIAGTYTLASSPSTAVSMAPTGERYTAFTGALIEILRSGDPFGPEFLTLGDLFEGSRRRMQARGFPLPTQKGTDFAHYTALGRNMAFAGNGNPGSPSTLINSSELVDGDSLPPHLDLNLKMRKASQRSYPSRTYYVTPRYPSLARSPSFIRILWMLIMAVFALFLVTLAVPLHIFEWIFRKFRDRYGHHFMVIPWFFHGYRAIGASSALAALAGGAIDMTAPWGEVRTARGRELVPIGPFGGSGLDRIILSSNVLFLLASICLLVVIFYNSSASVVLLAGGAGWISGMVLMGFEFIGKDLNSLIDYGAWIQFAVCGFLAISYMTALISKFKWSKYGYFESET